MLCDLFPDGWEDLGRSTGAVTRLRGFESLNNLFRTLLLHVGLGWSLRETAVHASRHPAPPEGVLRFSEPHCKTATPGAVSSRDEMLSESQTGLAKASDARSTGNRISIRDRLWQDPATNLPPCAPMIEREMASPITRPFSLVVTNVSNTGAPRWLFESRKVTSANRRDTERCKWQGGAWLASVAPLAPGQSAVAYAGNNR